MCGFWGLTTVLYYNSQPSRLRCSTRATRPRAFPLPAGHHLVRITISNMISLLKLGNSLYGKCDYKIECRRRRCEYYIIIHVIRDQDDDMAEETRFADIATTRGTWWLDKKLIKYGKSFETQRLFRVGQRKKNPMGRITS